VIKAGIVGTGFSAASHVDALRRVPGIEVAAIVGRTAERAREAAAELGVARAYGSLDELLADEEIRVVHNCTPNDLHAEVNTALLEAERHVLAEKPLARDGREARALAALAADADVVAGVCFNYRHYPLVAQMRQLVAERRYGPLHLVHGGYLQDWLLHEDDWSWRLDPARNGPSRAVADIGSHWLDLVQHVTGDRVVDLCASLGTAHEWRTRPVSERATFASGAAGAVDEGGERYHVDTEDFASVLVRFAGGAQGSFTVSQVSAGRKNRLHVELDGADGALAWDQEDPGKLWVGHRGRPNEVLFRDPTLLAPGFARLPGGHEEGWLDALRNLVVDFYGAVAAHDRGEPYAPTFASFDDGAQLCELVDAVLASHVSGGWTHVGAVEGVEQ
jgi:predicted dehydrogenase